MVQTERKTKYHMPRRTVDCYMFLNKKIKKINVTKVGHNDPGIFEDDGLFWLYSAPTYTTFCFHPFLKWNADINYPNIANKKSLSSRE